MKKYDEFDAALLAHIAAGDGKAIILEHKADIKELAKPHQTIDRWGSHKPVFRVVDTRLQALRKARRIRFNGKQWEIYNDH